MKNLRTSPFFKALALLLTALFATVGFWSSLITAANWDSLWSGDASGFYDDSGMTHAALYSRMQQAYTLAEIYQEQKWTGTQSYLGRQRWAATMEALSADATNFRFQIHAQDGTPVANNLGGRPLKELVHSVTLDSFQFTRSDPQQDDARRVTVEYVLEYGLNDPLDAKIHDEFWHAQSEFGVFQSWLPELAALALALDLLTVALLVFLCSAAGWRRGEAAVRLNWQDRVPFDLYLLLLYCACALLLIGSSQIFRSFHQAPTIENTLGLGVVSFVIACLCLALLLTLATRLKARRLLRGTLVWRLCLLLGRGGRLLGLSCGKLWRNRSMVLRVGLLFLLYLAGTVLTGLTVFLIPIYQGVVLYLILRWVKQWQAIRSGAARIIGGEPDFRIDTARLYPDLRAHAAQLNDLGGAVGSAVDERLKSERFKAELITNVSHDLKTPLTSIINYVDLLKKETIENPKAAEYIEVLDRKSQRLKKLTEDLVEASKASTGALTVTSERLSLTQLVRQALGEYEEKFEQKRLELVATLPDEGCYVQADGHHLWRIIDNLLSNCSKYALEGTRVYLEVSRWDGNIALSVKNISRQALNLPAEQLMERFVRGDTARHEEGSGLGLSIARSLTELQGGTFRLSIDGDLFKAVVVFPACAAPQSSTCTAAPSTPLPM